MSYAHAMRPGSGYGSDASGRSLRRLRDLGVTWVSITPFGFQRRAQDATFRWFRGAAAGFGESDERLTAVTRQAHALGLKVMLKPHLWLRPPDWPGSIEPQGEEDWQEWFRTYREFILHYALLARMTGMDALCVGNELEKTTGREREWRQIVAAVRAAYPGPITYGAAFEEVFRLPFWDALDFIGVSAYYPLVAERAPSPAALAAAWKPVADRLAALAAARGRKVVFTEIGYRSADFGAWRHWEVPDTAPVNLALQADAYAAFFEAVWPREWMGGVYWWKWFSHPNHSGPESNDFEMEGKPAARVVRLFYRAAVEKKSSRGGGPKRSAGRGPGWRTLDRPEPR